MAGAREKRWHTREDSGLLLDRNLRWLHDGEPIDHPRIVALFDESLAPTDDGRFQLRIGSDWAYVTVEDAAYRVTGVDAGDTAVFLRLSDRTGEALDPSTLVLEADGVLTARVKGGRAKARFSRAAQVALGALLEESGEGLVLALRSARVPVALPAALVRDG
ncbi:MAG TPA: DUF1285 domain-containing protein [Myxococcaceae bacterium]|jgi:hypothetical protein|nr:DUF1285 domain-containing protein [Myxococcaceae bacterium]